jgi:uncharacterized protein involved in outer membrane biogenesis
MTHSSIRRVAWWAGGTTAALLLVLGVGLGVGEAMGWSFLRQPLQSAASRAAGVPVSMEGRFELHLLGPARLQVEHLHIAPAQGLALPHLLDARQVELTWHWGDLWRWHRGGALHVQGLVADSFDARLLRLENGLASWQLGPQPAPGAKPPASPLQGVPSFTRLQLRQGHITVEDQPLQTQLQVELRGAEGQALPGGTSAGYQASVTGRRRALPIQLKIATGATLTQLQQAQAQGEALQLPLRVEGLVGAAQVLFEGRTAMPGRPPDIQGSLQLSGPSLAQVGAAWGLTLPRTPPFELRGTLGLHGQVWTLRAEHAAIGRSLLNGEFRFDTGTKPPLLQGQLGGARLVLADLASAVGAPTQRPGAARPARVLPQRRFNLPSLSAMNADLQIAIGELDFGSDGVKPLRDLRTHLALQGGVLQLTKLQATVAGGQFSGSTSLDANQQPALWGVELQLRQVDLVGWLPALRTDPGRAQAKGQGGKALKQRRHAARQGGNQEVLAYLTGSLDGQVQVTGRGRSAAEILATLDGNARLVLRDGSLSHLATEVAGLDLAQALGVLVQSDRPLPLRCARLDLKLEQGVARPRLAVLDNSDSTISVDGQVDLRDESLALRATVKPKDFSPLSLRAPIVVGGTLAAPTATVEVQGLATKLLGALALGAVAGPIAAMVPLIDSGQADAADPCTTPAKDTADRPGKAR